jgi:hypothetical protein
LGEGDNMLSYIKKDITFSRWFLKYKIFEPDLAGFVSLILPGLGQNYSGRYERGFVIAAMVAAGLVFFIVPGILLWIGWAYDSCHTVQMVNRSSLQFIPVNEEGVSFTRVLPALCSSL